MLTQDDVVGAYTMVNPSNDWHFGKICRDGSELKWVNRAGREWRLIPDLENNRLLTDETNPYRGTCQSFDVVENDGKVQGFRFNDDSYNLDLLSVPSEGVQLPHMIADQSALGFEWCWVPASLFKMGEKIVDRFKKDNQIVEFERPRQGVKTEGFWIMRHTVTQAAFGQFIDDRGYDDARWWKVGSVKEIVNSMGSFDRASNLPAEDVSYYEACAFCEWASNKMGRKIRLPTEAEWELAARSTDDRRYPWGTAAPTMNLATITPSEDWARKKGQAKPTAVGSHSPQGDSPYGCADMAGNVWELTGTVNGTPLQHAKVVARGQSSRSYPIEIDMTSSMLTDPFLRLNCGFRCLCESPG